MTTYDDEFTELASARWRALVRTAVLLGCTSAEAEDVVQSALLQAYVKWDRVRRADDRVAYVTAIVVNTHRESRRRRWWGERPAADPGSMAPTSHATPDATGSVDDADAVRRALDVLSTGQREVVVLRFYAHLQEAQIAAALGIAPGTVKSRLSRGLAVLAADPGLTALQEGRPS